MKQLPERFRPSTFLALILALALCAGCAPKSETLRLAEAGQERGDHLAAAYYAAKELEAAPTDDRAMGILAANYGPALNKGKLALEQATTALASGQNMYRCLESFDQAAEKMELILQQARQLGQGPPAGIDMPLLRRDFRRALAPVLGRSFDRQLGGDEPQLAMDDFRLAREKLCAHPEGREVCSRMSSELQNYLLAHQQTGLLFKLAKDAPQYLTPQTKKALAKAALANAAGGDRFKALEIHQALDKAGYKPSKAKVQELRKALMRTVAVVADDQSKGFTAAPTQELAREAARQIYNNAQLAKALDVSMLVRPGELGLDKLTGAGGKLDKRLEGATHLLVIQIVAAQINTRGPVMTKRKAESGWRDTVKVPTSLLPQDNDDKKDKDKSKYTNIPIDYFEYDLYTESKTARMAAFALMVDLRTRHARKAKLAANETARTSWADNFMAVHDYGRKLLDEPPRSIRDQIPPATAMPTDAFMTVSLARQIGAQAAEAMVAYMGPPK